MAIQHGGKSPTAGSVKTPAPSAQARTGGVGYGESSYSGPSSLPPGASGKAQTTLGKNMADSRQDPLLDSIIAKGTAKSGVDLAGSPQTRSVSNHGLPPAHGHRHRSADDSSPGGTVPSKVGFQNAQPIRKPGA